MSIAQKFKDAMQKSIDRRYVQKFAIGDVILCKKYLSLRKIEAIVDLEWDNSGKMIMYKMSYFGRNPESKFAYETIFREARVIDWAYEKVNEQTARILYGKK